MTTTETTPVTPEAPKAEVPTPEVKETRVEKKETTPKYDRGTVYYIPPEDFLLIYDKEDPLFDPRVLLPIDKNMVANVDEYGVQEPVIAVRRDGKPTPNDGRQRVRWGLAVNENRRKKGLPEITIPTIIKRDGEEEQAATSIFLNSVRQDDDMLTKARKGVKFQSQYHYSDSKMAKLFGVHPTSYRIWMKLMELSPEVQKAVDEGKITASAALQLQELPANQQKAALEGLLAAAEVEEKEGNPTTDEGDGEKKPARLKDRKTGKIKITAAKVAAAAKDKGAAPKAQDKAQEGIAPKRAQVRRALKYLIEKKGTYARTMGATLAWVLGDLDAKRTELEELAADTKELVREVFRASAKKVIKVATKE